MTTPIRVDIRTLGWRSDHEKALLDALAETTALAPGPRITIYASDYDRWLSRAAAKLPAGNHDIQLYHGEHQLHRLSTTEGTPPCSTN